MLRHWFAMTKTYFVYSLIRQYAPSYTKLLYPVFYGLSTVYSVQQRLVIKAQIEVTAVIKILLIIILCEPVFTL